MGRPVHALALGQLVGQSEQHVELLEESCPGALIAAPGGGPLAHLGPLGRGDGIELVLALLTAREDPNRMQLTAGTAAGRFTTFAAQQIKGAWGQRTLGGHRPQRASDRAVLAPEPLPQDGKVLGHLYSSKMK